MKKNDNGPDHTKVEFFREFGSVIDSFLGASVADFIRDHVPEELRNDPDLRWLLICAEN